MRKINALMLSAFLLAGTAPAFCKSKDKSEKSNKNSSTAVQIIEAVEAEKLTEDEKAELKKKQEERMDNVINSIADQAHMSDEQKEKLKARIKDGRSGHDKMPPELKERLMEKLDPNGFCKDTAKKVMEDHLSESDMKNLLKFLKSSTGKKLIKQAPDMMSEVIELAAIKYMPIVMESARHMRMAPGMLPPGMMPRSGMDNLSPEQKRQMMEKLKQLFENGMPHLNPQSPPPSNKDDET